MDNQIQVSGSSAPIPSWVQIDDVSLTFTAAPDMDGAERLASTLGMLKDGMPFYIGDFLNATEATFGEAASQVADMFGEEYDYGTLANYKSTCARVKPEVRRVMPSMGHCAAVAYMDEPEQLRWLQDAKDNKLTVRKLRDQIEAEKLGEVPEKVVDFVALAQKEIVRLESLAAEAPLKAQLDLVNKAIDAIRNAAAIGAADGVVIEAE
jgi:hypothetical protein